MTGAGARIPGHGRSRAVAQAAEAGETTVRKAVDEWEAGADPLGRVRPRPGGGGRKKAVEVDTGLRPELSALVEPAPAGTGGTLADLAPAAAAALRLLADAIPRGTDPDDVVQALEQAGRSPAGALYVAVVGPGVPHALVGQGKLRVAEVRRDAFRPQSPPPQGDRSDEYPCAWRVTG
ncbi:hypothetical protein GCM10010207_61410 [Streptomyces atratus]|uniref:hypothetical protein n=1 Tax=Streptomyces atratus TaxID=1893 RepID=UPI0019B68C16|nr:hypothetical protein GCM10010207_61410 [Streptomyces atratus]